MYLGVILDDKLDSLFIQEKEIKALEINHCNR